ncbi:MAG: alpha/beta fold hydrolase [Candidatus Pacebacteria bacterium]|nr:alpha/beta fold hydrolase [Candidatus Paceibacterota bacterium]
MKKILLLHGWNYANYKNIANNPDENPWHNRQGFVDLLRSHGFEIITPSFPGFVGYSYSEPQNSWNIDDYVNYCNELVEQYRPDAVLGYSFGGAVVALWKSCLGLDSEVKIVLISPALERQYEKGVNSGTLMLKKMLPNFLVNLTRYLYLRFIVKNPYYLKGTKFLRGSYLSIVKVKCGQELKKIRPEQILLLFGSKDTATPPELLEKVIAGNQELLNRVVVILGGGHDIANTHTEELVENIKKFI